MTNAEIIEMAILIMAADEASSPDDLAVARLEAAFERLGGYGDVQEGVCVLLANKLLMGLPYGICTDRPES
jgi:hypothetical protein